MALVIEFPRAPADRFPDPSLVALLKSFLERAKQGELQSLVLIAAGCDGHPECAMQLDRGHAVNMIGTLRVAEGRITAALEEVVDE